MLKYTINVLVVLSLGVWIGAIALFGAGVAPALFSGDILSSRTIAGAINSAVLGHLGRIEIVCGILAFGGGLYTALHYRSVANWGMFVLCAAMLGTSLYYTQSLFPRMNDLRVAIGSFESVPSEKAELRAEFDRGHALYSTLVKGVLLAGVVAISLQVIGIVRYGEVHARRHRDLSERFRKERAESGAKAEENPEEKVSAASDVLAPNGRG